MTSTFRPNLTILKPPQLRLWKELSCVPPSFVLCGGTAVALRLGHRESVDFDFLSADEFDPDTLWSQLPFLSDSQTVQKSAGTLTSVVNRDGPVQVSFFGTPKVRLTSKPDVTPDNGVRVATLVDLAGMKAAVVQKRAEAKDYLDLDAIIQRGRIELSTALAAAQAIYGSAYNPELTLKSLSFFGDGTLPTLPAEVRDRLVEAVRSVDLMHLPHVPSRTL